ncbi:MAG: FCD domain-containing protein, partial [Planctomycetes bacterium]|nr:FCD domain-containing protein [Planctomycetota bacterium]
RTIIEPELAAMAAKHARREAVTELQGFCDEVEELHNAGQDHTASDFRLHVGIAAASGNTVAPKLISILSTSITIVTEVTERRIMRETIEFHQQAVTAIRKRQPRRARQALLDHMRFNIDTILALPDRTIAGPLPAAGGGA